MTALISGNPGRLPRAMAEWEDVLASAGHHMVRPYLLHRMHSINLPMPQPILEDWKQVVRQITLRILLNQHQLLQVTDLLGTNNIPAVPFKGSVWAHGLYGSIELRESSDIDLMIKPEDSERVRAVLLEHNYLEEFPVSVEHRKKIQRVQGELKYIYFDDHHTAHLIEPHHRSNHIYAGFFLSFADLQDRIITQKIKQSNYAVYDPEATCILLVINNGVFEGWETLKYLLDLHQFLKKYPDADWNYIGNVLQSLGILTTLLVGIKLVHTLWETPVPPPFTKVVTSRRVGWLVNNRKKALDYFSISFSSQFNRWAYNILSRDSFWQSIKVFFRQFLYPTYDDYRFKLLPVNMFWAYPLVRMYRIIKKYLV